MTNGELKYHAWLTQNQAEDPPQGTIESLREVVRMVREYAIPEFPANDDGKVPFFRVVFDTVVAEIEASIRRQETDRETALANEKAIAAIPSLCRGDFNAPCPLHVSGPIRELWERKQ